MPNAGKDDEPFVPIVREGVNCWRVERARRAAVIVDAADYYHVIRTAMRQASKRILLIGWDFDVRIPLEPDAKGRGESLGRFMLRLARINPGRDIAILKWSFGAMKQWLRPRAAWTLLRWKATRAIRFRFDSAHPPGCSHHQKIAVIDDCFAVCGGIDISTARWDTPEHWDDQPRRVGPMGFRYGPWHDATMIVDGGVARALADLAGDRWQCATGEQLSAMEPCPEHWPDDVAPAFEDVDIAISRTRAAWTDHEEVREIEALFIDMIAAARRFIYAENQYLTAPAIAGAIAERMKEADPPEIVIVMPRTADGWLEQRAMDAARIRLARMVGAADRLDRFRVFVPVTEEGNDIYVHAKVSIVDDRFLRVGSANMNNRSLGLDSECDLAIDCALPANRGCRPAITALRERLMAEHLGCAAQDVAREFARTGSLIATIDRLTRPGRSLELLDLEKPGPFDAFIADNLLLDPERPEMMLEPLSRRSIWSGWRGGRERLRQRLRRMRSR